MADMSMKIRTEEQYRAASEEAQRLQGAAEGTTEFVRLQELTTAMHDYELAHLVDPDCQPGRPAGSI
jgi:antitoxin component HigA of HigAB toxin-antitoxin module